MQLRRYRYKGKGKEQKLRKFAGAYRLIIILVYFKENFSGGRGGKEATMQRKAIFPFATVRELRSQETVSIFPFSLWFCPS